MVSEVPLAGLSSIPELMCRSYAPSLRRSPRLAEIDDPDAAKLDLAAPALQPDPPAGAVDAGVGLS